MIGLSDISWWGVALTFLLLLASVGVYAVVDRRIFQRVLKVMGGAVAQLLLVGAYVWGLCRLDSVWVDLLWLLLVSVLVAVLSLHKLRLPSASMVPAVSLSVLVGVGVMSGTMLLCLYSACTGSDATCGAPTATRLLVPIIAVLAGQLYASLTKGLQAYVGSLRHTRQHYQYLMACGATHLEAMMPSGRRSLRAVAVAQLRSMLSGLPVVPSLFFCGLLLGGTSPVVAAVVTLLLLLSAFAASVLSIVLLLFFSDRLLFDKQRQFVLWK